MLSVVSSTSLIGTRSSAAQRADGALGLGIEARGSISSVSPKKSSRTGFGEPGG